MKLIFYTSFTIIAILILQVWCDEEESSADKLKSNLSAAFDKYQKELKQFSQDIKSLDSKAENAFKDHAQKLKDTLDGVVSSLRERRSPQTFPDNQKDQTQEAIDKLNTAFSSLKTGVTNLFSNVSNSEVVSDISGHLSKFKETLDNAGNRIKASIHNYTAPDSKESEEKN